MTENVNAWTVYPFMVKSILGYILYNKEMSASINYFSFVNI